MTKTTQTRSSVLTQVEAEIRAQQIQDVDYLLHFQLPESDPEYSGQVEATLHVTSEAAQHSDLIFMDFSGGIVGSVALNGKPVEFVHRDQARIEIPIRLFVVGKNTLKIDFRHPYGKNGFGFHRTRDEADGKYYVYSDFEPYNANKAFPLFDQPDLKATYTVKVDAPSDWQVIANEKESQVVSQGKQKQWIFPRTKRFSSYLFALIAGPFKVWESRTGRGVPLRLFARDSLANYVAADAEHWFQVTNEGFKFFEKNFGYDYPFGKYDQILTPDYNHGAMENVAAVTFTERYVFRTPATPTRKLRRAETIIHELAHMWFGNLVTMKWWDDLWLNESFATYASNLAMAHFQEKIGTADVWQQFLSENKEWAYREDDSVTTHPIVGTAADTEEALANFDGITYGKGAAVLKQLVKLIGEKDFYRGLQAYFKKFEFKNATRTDFIQELSNASGRNLAEWENLWLKTSGTNSVEVVLTEKNGQIEKLVLRQSVDEASKILRPHQTDLGLYDLDASGKLILRETLSVLYADAETQVSAAVGKRTPQFIFPNVGDHDFVHVILDRRSVDSLAVSLGKVKDPLLRQMLWSTLWNMVRHAKLPARRFVAIAMEHLLEEKDLGVVENGLAYLGRATWYMQPSAKLGVQAQIESFVETLFDRAQAEDPMKILLFSQYLGQVRSEAGLNKIRGWLDQAEVTPGFKVDQERRWAILYRLSARSFPKASGNPGSTDTAALIQVEKERDKNDLGILSAMLAEIAFPEARNKELWWNRMLGKDTGAGVLSIEKIRRLMGSFHDEDRPEVTQFMREEFFKLIPHLAGKFPDEFNSSFAAMMYPQECSEDLNQKTTQLLDSYPNLQVAVRRELMKNRQLHQRTINARALDATYVHTSK